MTPFRNAGHPIQQQQPDWSKVEASGKLATTDREPAALGGLFGCHVQYRYGASKQLSTLPYIASRIFIKIEAEQRATPPNMHTSFYYESDNYIAFTQLMIYRDVKVRYNSRERT